ncbi:MAG: DUF4290 domain-containing protein [Bacteroidales bacterium]|nr:DUF4290 domain-containing protein [Bacteroidales bacterium]
MSFDYNTKRKKLVLPEYGRHIHKLVDYLMTIPDREERTKAAHALVAVMGNLNPHLRDVVDFKHKLWDHLAIMSDFKIDIDAPYPLPTKSAFDVKPRKVPYNQHPIQYKHYGKIIEQMIHKAVEMPEGEEKSTLIEMIANLMKRQYLTWNRDAVTDEVILKDLYELSKGKIKITSDMLKLSEARNIHNVGRQKNKKMSINKRNGGNGNYNGGNKQRKN